MVNPGIIYIIGALLLIITKDKIQKMIALSIPVITLLKLRFLTDGEFVISYLNFELIFYKYSEISHIIALVFTVFGLIAVIYSLTFNSRKHFVLINLYIGSSISILFCGDFFLFLIFWEMMTVSSYFLIYNGDHDYLKKSSLYYLVIQITGGVSLLLGIIIQYMNTGTIRLTTPTHGLLFFALAVGIKMAFIGLHYWLPKNYSKVPFHISVILSAYTTKVGVYAFYRLMGGLNIEYIGLIPAIVGVVMALKEIELRKILSYHLISQTGYMLTGIALGTEIGISSGFFHVVNHILYKGLLFMTAGTVIYTTGKEDLTFLGGLYKKLPLTMIAAAIGSLAISGFPFLNGYLSKLLIKKSAASVSPVIYYGLMIASIGTALSFLKFMYYTFFNREPVETGKKTTGTMKIGMVFVIILILSIGLNPTIFTRLFSLEPGFSFFKFSYIISGLIPILVGVLLFIIFSDIINPAAHRGRENIICHYFNMPDQLLEKFIHKKSHSISDYLYNILFVKFQGQLLWILILLVILFMFSI